MTTLPTPADEKDMATIELKNYKRAPGWYWSFGARPSDGEPGGRCGPYKTHGAAARSARANGYATVTKKRGKQ